jgi:hypothetical protein
MTPRILNWATIQKTHEGALSRPNGFAKQKHTGLIRVAIPLSAIAANAGSHNVFPRRFSATISGHHVVHVQFLRNKGIATVLTAISITLEEILPIELHLPQKHSIVPAKKKYTRHPHRLVHRMYQSTSFRGGSLC